MLRIEQLAQLFLEHREAIPARVSEFPLGGEVIPFNSRPTIMGVINLSPDSWYRESVCLNQENAVKRGRILHAQGADIIDLGAESTLPNANRAGTTEQAAKLAPVVKSLRSENILVSTETYLPKVARMCLEAGANVLNLTGSKHGKKMYQLAAAHDAAVILCYVQGNTVHDVGALRVPDDPIDTFYEYFAREIEKAQRCGLQKIIVDPGLGFYYENLEDGASRVRHQMKIFLNTFRLRTLGFPVCHALPHAFEYFGEEVRSAEPFFAVLAALGKTDVFRTHEVSKAKAVLDALSLL